MYLHIPFNKESCSTFDPGLTSYTYIVKFLCIACTLLRREQKKMQLAPFIHLEMFQRTSTASVR